MHNLKGLVFVVRICYLGDRLLSRETILNNETGEVECNKNETGPIFQMYCGGGVDPSTDPWCEYFNKSEVLERSGIPGLGSGVFFSEFAQVISRKSIELNQR